MQCMLLDWTEDFKKLAIKHIIEKTEATEIGLYIRQQYWIHVKFPEQINVYGFIGECPCS